MTSFLEVLSRRWLVVLLLAILGFALIPFVAKSIRAYKGTAEILIVSEAVKDTTESDPDLPSIITSSEVLSRVIKRLNLHTTPLALAKQVKTKLPPKSSLLELTYHDTDGDRAATVTNAIADEAASYFHEISVGGYNDVIKALNLRIADSQLQIAAANRRLQRASAESAFASSDNALDDLTSQINELRVSRGQLNASLAADQATSEALREQLHDIAPIVRGEILQKDPVVAQVQAGVAKDVADLSSQTASFQDTFPGLAALRRRVERERSQLQPLEDNAVSNGAGLSPSYTQTVLDSQRASGLVAADQARLAATDAQLNQEHQHLQQVAEAGAIVATLRAERDTALQQYQTLTQRLSAAQGDAAQAASLGTLVVVSRALPGPSMLWAWEAVFAILVLMLAAAAAYGFDVLDRRFWGVRDIERIYGRPVLIEVGGH